MDSVDRFHRQCEFFSHLQEANGSPMLYFLLGVVHARTNVDVQTLFPLVQESERSLLQRWITPEERVKVDFQVYLGYIGKARDLLSEFKEIQSAARREGVTDACAVCSERVPTESVFTVSSGCRHSMHLECAQSAVRRVMMQGGSPRLTCPCVNCPTDLSESDLTRLFTTEDFQILFQCWSQPTAEVPRVAVICPTFECKASMIWKKSQYFECLQCKRKYCLKCLQYFPKDSLIAHECRPVAPEYTAIGESFAAGSRFKVCRNCGYWCDLSGGKTVVCRCGRDICTSCVLYQDECECNLGIVQKIINLPDKLLRQL